MTRNGDEHPTRIYTRCEGCGKIVRPNADGTLPEGWIALDPGMQHNAGRAVCSQACVEKLDRTA